MFLSITKFVRSINYIVYKLVSFDYRKSHVGFAAMYENVCDCITYGVRRFFLRCCSSGDSDNIDIALNFPSVLLHCRKECRCRLNCFVEVGIAVIRVVS